MTRFSQRPKTRHQCDFLERWNGGSDVEIKVWPLVVRVCIDSGNYHNNIALVTGHLSCSFCGANANEYANDTSKRTIGRIHIRIRQNCTRSLIALLQRNGGMYTDE
jgi:hypothetical protein